MAGHSVGSGDGELGDTVVHGVVDGGFVIADAEMHRDVDIELGDDEARIGGGGLGDGGVDGGNAGGGGIARRNVSGDGGEDEAIILQKKKNEDNGGAGDNRHEASAKTGGFGFIAGFGADARTKIGFNFLTSGSDGGRNGGRASRGGGGS